jgi:hypothetical protein
MAHETKPASPPSLPDHRDRPCGCVCHDRGDDRITCNARGCCAAWRKGFAEGAALCLLDAPTPVAAPEHDAHEGTATNSSSEEG